MNSVATLKPLTAPFADARVVEACVHCGQPVPRGLSRFCCSGCEAVHGLLTSEGLLRYYDLRGGAGTPVQPGAARSHEWLAGIDIATGRLSVDVQGIHCSACVWLLDELFKREAGAGQIRVNPGIGRLDLWFDPARFDPAAYARRVESFGYLLGPRRKERSASRSLVIRLGICAALALNAMVLSFAFYFGLSPADGTVYRTFGWLAFGLATLAVLVGGTYFFRSAWHALRLRALHLDLPIALGIALSYAGSAWAFWAHGGGAAYFDTVATFITLMLVGKYLPERLLERNRSRVLQDDGADQLPQKKVGADGSLTTVAAGAVRQGDELAFAPGDLAVVDVQLTRGSASCSLDWITGEADPKSFETGQTVPAGAFNVGSRSFRGVALTDFAGSRIRSLLSAPADLQAPAERTPRERFFAAFSRVYVVAVLAIAAATFLGWWLLGGAFEKGMLSAVAVLVVTCPCAIGLAAPLAYELGLSRLRRRGIFLRTPGGLDKLAHVRELALDKTGTLTDGDLALANPEALDALAPSDLEALRQIVDGSNHPHSRALAVALARVSRSAAAADLACDEHAGQGVEATGTGHLWRLGARSFAIAGATTTDNCRPLAPGAEAGHSRYATTDAPTASQTLFAKNGVELAAFRFDEKPRPGAREDLADLERRGYSVQVLSGDSPARAVAVGASLGLRSEQCQGGLSPEAKAEWIRARPPRSVLMLGDGINDSLAFREAWCSGTPAVNRPFVPSRVDFYYLSPGLSPIGEALTVARRVTRTVGGIVGVALTYNAAIVALAAAGLVTPLFAAVAMPLSSVSFVLAASYSVGRSL
ncbi:MAG TPA: heavy metal translocating P-type ATPase metal-binding domain-containing protein [Myxococcales bacterium]|jgi:Cu2+-exporting ATPase